ncbi:Indole-3-acetic acid-induced protein ARG7 [Sesamum alatum]|uniref:Indole-3-acetic acid-induced protein ARG7 n=1 Tax=Sesamum alatum TaxID=300844 RepID=A0AAE1XMZ1_9LAMI|nr:Indole-3-acetic acid-induced protein ARG7 [Sesamum alatum]
MAAAMKKVNMITQIVRLKQVVQRWKTKSLTRRSVLSHSSSSSSSDSDEAAGCKRARTPSGSLAVYVGPDRVRFVIPTRFLNLPVFVALLHEAEEEFGFQTTGGLVLPCEPGFFREILRFLEEDEEKFGRVELDEFLNMVGLEPLDQSSCKESSSSASSHAFTPLLPKTRV